MTGSYLGSYDYIWEASLQALHKQPHAQAAAPYPYWGNVKDWRGGGAQDGNQSGSYIKKSHPAVRVTECTESNKYGFEWDPVWYGLLQQGQNKMEQPFGPLLPDNPPSLPKPHRTWWRMRAWGPVDGRSGLRCRNNRPQTAGCFRCWRSSKRPSWSKSQRPRPWPVKKTACPRESEKGTQEREPEQESPRTAEEATADLPSFVWAHEKLIAHIKVFHLWATWAFPAQLSPHGLFLDKNLEGDAGRVAMAGWVL